MEAKRVFLNCDSQKEVYMIQPLGFKVVGKKWLVHKLVKALYGLEHAPWDWYMKILKYLTDRVF